MKKISLLIITARHNFSDVQEKVNTKIKELHKAGNKVISVVPVMRNNTSPIAMIYTVVYETPEPNTAKKFDKKPSKEEMVREIAFIAVTNKNGFNDVEGIVNKKLEELDEQGRHIVSVNPFYKTTAPVELMYNIVYELPMREYGIEPATVASADTAEETAAEETAEASTEE